MKKINYKNKYNLFNKSWILKNRNYRIKNLSTNNINLKLKIIYKSQRRIIKYKYFNYEIDRIRFKRINLINRPKKLIIKWIKCKSSERTI